MLAPLRCLAALALSLGAAACAFDVTGSGNGFSARIDGAELVLHNGTSRTVYYFAGDRETLALMLWGPCADPATCDGIPAGRERRIGSSEVVGMNPNTREVIVYAWHLVPTSDGKFQPRWLDEVIVQL